VKNKGIVFTIDAVLALLFIILLSVTLHFQIYQNTKEVETILINNRISDLLITAQHLEINNIEILENNYKQLFENTPGYIKINNNKKVINKNNKTKLITQNIKYINSSNKEIYIEVGVYY
jgi:hypothetical protein